MGLSYTFNQEKNCVSLEREHAEKKKCLPEYERSARRNSKAERTDVIQHYPEDIDPAQWFDKGELMERCLDRELKKSCHPDQRRK